ncbi:uncharacterized protein [Coffea arabica]|uniref:MADS-box domain-containing protein n=1 Tax=Coffea arabica TaxID=13443 RepID=A0A6P6W229_COFAR|nr:uncharacterized protein LOC113729340 [Coffea arabica]
MVASTNLEHNSMMNEDKQATKAESSCSKKTKHGTKVESLSCKKRKECIKKKTMELSVLCGIKACIVVVGPSGQVETWPRNPDDVRQIIAMYKDLAAKKGCQIKRFSESSVKVGKAVDNAAEKAKIDEDFGSNNGCRKQEEKGENSSSKAFAEDIVKVINSKLESLEKKKGFLSENKGKEVAYFYGEEETLHEKYFTELWNVPEVGEASDSQGTGKPQLGAAPEQSAPSLETMFKQNLFENPQIFGDSSDNSEMGLLGGASANQEIVQHVPMQFNFNSSNNFDGGINLSNLGIHNVQFPNVQFPHQFPWFDSSNYQTGMLSVMPQLQVMNFPQLPLIQGMNLSGLPLMQGMNFSAGPSMQSTTLAPHRFDEGSLPQLCPLPLQAFGPEYHSPQPLTYNPSSSSWQQYQF